MTMTNGEYRVGVNFNPSGDDLVADIKLAAAELIDMFESIRAEIPETEIGDVEMWEFESEVCRLKELAKTHIETAAMYAVKAATKRPRT
jgi:hypothetical protein